MAGGIIQLVANTDASQNVWLNHDPEITFFKCVYRRHTMFALEMVPLKFNSRLDFGDTATVTFPKKGDLVHRAVFSVELPYLAAKFTHTKTADTIQLISQLQLIDQQLEDKIKSTVISDAVDFISLIDLVESHLQLYSQQINQKLSTLLTISTISTAQPTQQLIHQLRNASLSPAQRALSEQINPSSIPLDTTSHSGLSSDLVHSSLKYGLSYNAIDDFYLVLRKVLNQMATTVPIVVIKAFEKTDFHLTASTPVIIDPNYRRAFFATYRTQSDETDPPYCYTSRHPIDTSSSSSPYHRLVYSATNTMMSTICHSMEQLFSHYHDLFTCTSRLFYLNSTVYSGIYSYTVPSPATCDSQSEKLSVINLNIWFFYFFKYLDAIDECDYADYLSQHYPIDEDGYQFIVNLMVLLKINLEYYMHEISYMMNDLYASTSSLDPTSTLKIYRPEMAGTNLFTCNIIFHRNLVPTIQEMREYIQLAISEITIAQINSYLCTKLHPAESQTVLRGYVTNLYASIFAYFDGVETDPIATSYVDKFLASESVVVEQMEFYYHAENIYTSAYNTMMMTILDPNAVEPECAKIIEQLLATMQSTPDLYYQTVSTDRYMGEPYLSTPYQSRFHHYIHLPDDTHLDPPFPLPPSDPYGVNPEFYNHSLSSPPISIHTDLVSLRPSELSDSLFHPPSSFSKIDFSRIRHALFTKHHMLSPEIQFVDEYDLAVQYATLVIPDLAHRDANTHQKLVDALQLLIQCTHSDLPAISVIQTYHQLLKQGVVPSPDSIEQVMVSLEQISTNKTACCYPHHVPTITSNRLIQQLWSHTPSLYGFLDLVGIGHSAFRSQVYHLYNGEGFGLHQSQTETWRNLLASHPHCTTFDAKLILQHYNGFQSADDIHQYLLDDLWHTSTLPSTCSQRIAQLMKPHDDLPQLVTNSQLISTYVLHIKKSIVQLRQQSNQLSYFREKLSVIFYRNQRSKAAWIHKLGAYLVESVTFKCGDDVVDLHTSEWRDTFDILQCKSLDTYHQMIGHQPSLYSFTEEPKPTTTIHLPFNFYFNQSISSSIPLIASSHVTYSLTVKLRSLEQVAYHEEFAEYVDVDGNPVVPQLTNPILHTEFVYLSSEERKIFTTKPLEYLITTSQYNSTCNVSDVNLDAVYKIATVDGKHQYLTQTQLDATDYVYDVVPVNYYYAKPSTNKSGIRSTHLANLAGLYGQPADNKIAYKTIRIQNHFTNPTRFITTMIRPISHVDVNSPFRLETPAYFHGEHQWDNYHLYPRYDLSAITIARLDYYDTLTLRLQNTDDETFGFVALLGKILHPDAHRVYHALVHNPSLRKPNQHGIRYKMDTMDTMFPVFDYGILEMLCEEIMKESGKSNLVRFDADRLPVSYDTFALRFGEIVSTEVVDYVYQIYNEAVINSIVYHVSEMQDLDTDYSYHQIHLRLQGTDWYKPFDEYIVYKPKNQSTFFHHHLILHATTFSSYQQNLQTSLRDTVVSQIAKEMATCLCEMLNTEFVELTDYSKALRLNPIVSPIVSGHYEFNTVPILPINSTQTAHDIATLLFRNDKPSLMTHSWALDPASPNPSGQANLSKIDEFTTQLNLHPMISTAYPARVISMTSSYNITRLLAGQSGRTW